MIVAGRAFQARALSTYWIPGQRALLRHPKPYVIHPGRSFTSTPRPRSGTQDVPPPAGPSLLRRAFGFLTVAILFTGAGFIMNSAPLFKLAHGYSNPPSDEETLSMFIPGDGSTKEIEDYIRRHPLALEMRAKPGFTESRPHLKIPESQRSHSLTGGILQGPGRVVVPPLVWSEDGGRSLVSISYLGNDLCGHPGLIHGGLLATLLDEGMAKCCFPALPHKLGVTANLNINYRSPAPAGTFVVLKARTTKVEGRKAWVEAHIETLVAEEKEPVVLADASALFIEPRQAASLSMLNPVR